MTTCNRVFLFHFFLPFGFDFPATLIAIAIACFCGFFACISLRIFSEIPFLVLALAPFKSGIIFPYGAAPISSAISIKDPLLSIPEGSATLSKSPQNKE